MRVIGVIALSLGVAAAASASAGRPALRVTDLSPFTVHGWRFDSGQNLRVVISTKRRIVRRLDANRDGAFTLRIRHFTVKRCAQYAVAAYGPSGALLAAVKSAPQSCGADLDNP
jgi:hypothetical protein